MDKDYIDLDKINVTPENGGIPGLSKVMEKELNEKVELKKQQKTEAKIEIVNENKAKPIMAKKNVASKKVKKRVKTKKTSKVNESKNKVSKKVSDPKKKKKKTSQNFFLRLGVALLALAGIILLTLFLLRVEPETKSEKVVVLVNGVPIYDSQIDAVYKWFMYISGEQIPRQEIIDLYVDLELLSQEAHKRKLEVSSQELDELFIEVSDYESMTLESFKEELKKNNINFNVLSDYFEKWLISKKVIDSLQINVSEEELLETYELMKESLIMPERVNIKHIFVSLNNRTEEEAQMLGEQILLLAQQNKQDFCELVKNYSEDIQTKDSCGEYTFGRQESIKDEFVDQSFEMNEDEIKLITSLAGVHIIHKIEHISEGYMPFEDAKLYLEQMLEEQILFEAYTELLTNIKNNATIEYYSEKQLVTLDNGLIISISNETETQKEISEEFELTEEETEIFNETNASEEQEIFEEPEQEFFEESEITTQSETTQETQSKVFMTEQAKLLSFVTCLNEKNAMVFNTYWSPDSQAQMTIFGEYAKYIKNYECDASAPNNQANFCSENLVKTYPTWPTWKINGQIYEGYHSLQKLSSVSGCVY